MITKLHFHYHRLAYINPSQCIRTSSRSLPSPYTVVPITIHCVTVSVFMSDSFTHRSASLFVATNTNIDID
ncbi:uncharacterized protein LACBIDRAFT_318413 [Laccaria bicolor S238N-H82]|uniref:Predicted protein n=1 Tax=Laccaria bicolor (strain S238N-H82 / ATCC MYA-4686) TaxID=486041 RepID=B0E2G6_LACBS|nr:uncharacterized protein LACBIDRAFT_318413 [Laccaria bicolor S238N-H82]EDQ98973.1 predicted protein [Laccaria bicolor S238N-H82]|eukprot:XP_001890375.1 predicted protein [Laccaria bicolor S238N-H82]